MALMTAKVLRTRPQDLLESVCGTFLIDATATRIAAQGFALQYHLLVKEAFAL